MTDVIGAVKALEESANQLIRATPLPCGSWERGVTALLMVTEDQIRLPVLANPRAPQAMQLMDMDADDAKFSLKHALNQIRLRHNPATRKLTGIATESECMKAAALLAAGHLVECVRAPLIAHSRGRCEAVMTNEGLDFRRDPKLHRGEVSIAIESAYMGLRSGEGRLSADQVEALTEGVELVGGQVSVADGRVQYVFDRDTARKFMRVADFEPLPSWWRGMNMSADQINRVLRALWGMAHYHWGAVTAAVRRFDLPFAGSHSTPYVRSRETIVRHLAELAEVDTSVADAIVRLLTYGECGVLSPDPALQPLIELRPGLLATAPFGLVISGNLTRNFLSLTAKIDPDAFNSISDGFAKDMTNRVADPLESKGFLVRREYHIPGHRPVGDIDVLVISPSERSILVLELRWMIGPGEVSEFFHREEDVPKKTQQAAKKVASVKQYSGYGIG
jgi:hypothetical protein